MNDYITKDILKCLKVPPATKCRVERKMTEEEVYGILKKARGTRLSFSVMGKGQKRREVLAGRMVSKKIWHQIQHLSDDQYLFGHRKSHYSRWWAQRHLKRLNPKVSPHWLRHAFCSLSIQKGCDVGTVSIAMGHTNLATTRRYCHSAEKPPGEYLEEAAFV